MTAPVSGPGALSRRTDTGGQKIRDLPDPDYGEAKQFRETQKAAPLAKAGEPSAPAVDLAALAGATEGEDPVPGREPLPDPFESDPSIPVTSGAPIGPGANRIDGLPQGQGLDFNPRALRDALEPYVVSDQTGILDDVVQALMERGLY